MVAHNYNLAPRRLIWENCEFNANLGNIVSSVPALATHQDPVSKMQKKMSKMKKITVCPPNVLQTPWAKLNTEIFLRFFFKDFSLKAEFGIWDGKNVNKKKPRKSHLVRDGYNSDLWHDADGDSQLPALSKILFILNMKPPKSIRIKMNFSILT